MRIAAIIIVLLFEAAWPQAASSQTPAPRLTHLDSVVAQSLAHWVHDRVGSDVIFIGDSALRPLLAVALPASQSGELPVFYVEHLTATRHGNRHDGGGVKVDVDGILVARGPTQARERKTFHEVIGIQYGSHEWDEIETIDDPFVRHEATHHGSFWASTLEPALVVIGAAVIVALFFLVRG